MANPYSTITLKHPDNFFYIHMNFMYFCAFIYSTKKETGNKSTTQNKQDLR